TVMAVLTRHPQTGVEYRFVAAAYEPSLFLHDSGQGPQGVAYNELTAGLRQAGINFSRKFDSTSEYRSIILNDLTQLRGNNRDSRQLRQMALRYSLVEPGHRLRHMEKLVTAIHAKEGKMDTLKTMLAAIFEEDGVELPVTRLRNQQTRAWIRRMRQSLHLDKLAEAFAHWERIGGSLTDSESRLRQIQPQLSRDSQEHEQTAADAAAKLNEISKTLQRLQETYQAERAQLTDQKLEHQQAADKTRHALDDIQKRFDAYLDQDMDALAQAMEQLPGWRRDREQQAEQLRVLKAEVGDAQQEFDRHKTRLLEELDEAQQETQQQINEESKQLEALRNQHEQQRQELATQYYDRREQTLRTFSEREAGYRQERGEVLTQLQASLLTPDELDSQREAQRRIEQCQQAASDAAQQLATATQAWQQARHAHEQALAEQQELRRARVECERACQRLQRQFDPASGTLRHFLRGQLPGWEQHIGKLVREDLLERSDLAPQRIDGEPNLWGLQLDLNVIEAPDYARDEVALKEALAKAHAEREQAQARENRYADEVKRLAEAAEQQQQSEQEASRKQETARQDVDYALGARDRLQEELDAKARARRKALRERQERLEQQLETLGEEQASRLDELKDDYSRQQLELRADNDEQETGQQQRIDRLQDTLARRREDTNTRIGELQAHFDAQLAERGIDHEAIRAAQDKLDQLVRRIRQTQDRSEELSEYQRFIRVEWQKEKPELVAREAQLAAQLREDTDALEQARRDHEKQRDEQRQTQQQWQTVQRQSNDRLDALGRILQQLQQLALRERGQDDAESTPDWGDQDERIERARNLLQEHGQQQLQLDKGLKQFNADLVQGATDDYAQRMNYEIERLEQGEPPHLLDYLAIYRDMLQLLRDEQTELLQQGRNIGGDLNKFFTVFRDLNRRIHAQSRRLSDEVANDLTLEGISRAEVQIRSTIDQLDFWQPLSRFAGLYEAWEGSGRELPGEDYLNALADVAELLRQDQQYTFESLLQLELRLTEGGNDLIIRSDRQLLESSSHGMAYLILCQFMLAFTRLLRGPANVAVHWPVDEIGTLAYRNVEQLFAACDANRILVLGAFPNAESDVLTLFKHRYLIERETPASEVRRLKRIEPKPSPLAEKLDAVAGVLA
ncbi:MAG: ATP-binding protein, partial [Luteimonas sp.]|nr:ATP-binding protein [Luteimonas sp.]